MAYSYFRKFVRLFALLLAQVLVCNNIHLFGYATPLIVAYFIIAMEKGVDRVTLLLYGFVAGLLCDMFSNTAGMVSAGMTLLAMIQPGLLSTFSPRETDERMYPNVQNMGFGNYSTYVFVCMLVVHSVFFMLDAFMLSNLQLTIIAVLSSSVLATVIALFVERLTSTSNNS